MFRENYQHSNSFSIDTQASKACKSCRLCCNQPPLIQKKNEADVVWVGLSAVKVSPFENTSPLSIQTNTGSIINQIELNIQNVASFYKTNLVKCLPLKNDKIRYPKVSEMEQCFSFLKKEIEILEPRIIFLLGRQVSDFVLKKYNVCDFNLDPNFEYESYEFRNMTIVPIHHPSYIFIYKRKRIVDYINGVSRLIKKEMSKSKGQATLIEIIKYSVDFKILEIKYKRFKLTKDNPHLTKYQDCKFEKRQIGPKCSNEFPKWRESEAWI